jgi:hypothetical protein
LRLHPVVFALIGSAAVLSAQADQAQALVQEGAAFFKKSGREAFLKEVNMGGGRFHVKAGGELYLFVYDETGTCLAHGFNLKQVGMNRIGAKDGDGKLYVLEYLTQAKAKGSAWVNYKYTDPTNNKVEAKSSFVLMVDGLFIGCGTYKK